MKIYEKFLELLFSNNPSLFQLIRESFHLIFFSFFPYVLFMTTIFYIYIYFYENNQFYFRYNGMSRQVTNAVLDWICILMLILGTIGNLLGLIVFSSRKFRRTSYGRLAIASLIINLLCVFRYSFILHSKTRRWITYTVGQTWFNCKLYRVSSCLRILSAFVIVAWTYERFTYVTINYSSYINHPSLKRYKFSLMALVSFLIVGALTGPTVYFYQPKLIPLTNEQNNVTLRYEREPSVTSCMYS